ncbi:MAG: hypothetical protein KC635_18855 [Myxococcales bacterium]|nr:hypothetical protein [Myxococcales bacterium]
MGLVREGARLVSIIGIGGLGKTRVAIAASHRAAEEGLDVAYCDVVAVHSAAEVALAVANALDVELPDSLSRRDPVDLVAAAIARRDWGRGTLLVVDNFEHLARTRAGEALPRLVSGAPRIQLLVTSRVALERPEELRVPLAPLACAGDDSPAVELLLARTRHAALAEAWRADRGTLARLAARLDGLPLALELAAARAHVVTPERLLALFDERLSLAVPGVEPRRASREAAVAWSFEQLGASAREALTRLAVVEGTLDLELVAGLLARDPQAALAEVEELCRFSLVTVEPGADAARYRILETVRDFALAQASPERVEASLDRLASTLIASIGARLEVLGSGSARLSADAARASFGRYLAILRRGLTTTSQVALADAVRVAGPLLDRLDRVGLVVVAIPLVLELMARPEVEALPFALRHDAATACAVFVGASGEPGPSDAFIARALAWTETEGDALEIARMRVRSSAVAAYHWRFAEVLAHGESLVGSPLLDRDPSLHLSHTVQLALARRALGEATWEEDGERLVAMLDSPAVTSHQQRQRSLLINIAYLAHQLGRTEIALDACDRLDAYVALDDLGERGHGARERARALLERGAVGAALAHYDRAIGAFGRGGPTREWTETSLDRVAAALEAGRYDEARSGLAATLPELVTAFDRGYHTALQHALLALLGGRAGQATPERTDTVEDSAFDAYVGVGRREGPRPARAAQDATSSFRVRQALRLLARAEALRAGDEGVIGVTLDGSGFRAGDAWVDLRPKPLLANLVGALTEARLEGLEPVGKEALGAALWPDERLSDEVRDRRLYSALSALRREGLGDAIVAHDGGFGIDPARAVMRVSLPAWPGPTGEVKRTRGRGRPRKRRTSRMMPTSDT